MGLKPDEIIAVTIVCVFYSVLLGRYSIRHFKRWCNRKKKAADTDIEAQNGIETTETEESSSLSDPRPSSSSLGKVADIGAQNETTTTDESSPLPDPQSSSSVLVQKPKPCVLTTLG